MSGDNPIRNIDFTTPGAAKRCRKLRDMPSGCAVVDLSAIQDRAALARRRLQLKSYGGELFHLEKVLQAVAIEIAVGKSSVITRGALKMSEHVALATEAMEAAIDAMAVQSKAFNEKVDQVVAQAKTRVSQLTDYNNRLGTALKNLNATLGDEKMLRALENAEKLTTALALLDKLEQSGSLCKIMQALTSSKS